uniref:KIF-binding protein n=1 Tax=Haemonchus contortus TaxID=6289 RepID=A0A7I4Z7K7_HAECO
MSEREVAFEKARALGDEDKADEALSVLSSYTTDPEVTLSLSEMEVLNTIITEKLTSCSFEDKKEACNVCIGVLENFKPVKDSQWLILYTESIYETFSRMSRCARDEERQLVWNRLKEIMYELTLASKKAWKEKNDPERLSIYVSFAKLCKSYLDVADQESFQICDNTAKEAKLAGKGTLDDDQWREANQSIEQIRKIISDALHERELLDDSE